MKRKSPLFAPSLAKQSRPNDDELERVAWLVAVILSCCGALWIMSTSWTKYDSNPVVVTLDKRYWDFFVAVPAATLCYVDRLDEYKADEFINKQWSVSSGPKYDYYMRFLMAVVNGTLLSLASFEEFVGDEELKNLDLVLLARDLAFDMSTTISRIRHLTELFYYPTLLEIGLCYSAVAPLAVSLADLQFRNKNKTVTVDAHCSPREIDCSAFSQDIERDFVVYFHEQMDLPHIVSQPPQGPVEPYTQIFSGFLQYDFTTSESFRQLRFEQRNCYLSNEQVYDHLPAYSYALCKMECRKRLIMDACKCSPYFYYNPEGTPLCHAEGLVCVSKNIDRIIEETKGKGCKCYAMCDNQAFALSDPRLRIFLSGAHRWQVMSRSPTRYRKDVIFAFSDLLVYVGGTAALFMGCSIMTLIEIVYFFTIRLLRLVQKRKNKHSPAKDFTFTDDFKPSNAFASRLKRQNFITDYTLY